MVACRPGWKRCCAGCGSPSLKDRLRDTRRELQRWFDQQQQFSATYSPLYAALFRTVAGWLEEEPPGAIASWLVEAAAGGDLFATTNLLAAGLHRDVLADVPAARELSAYYATAGGTLPAAAEEGGLLTAVPAFREALAKAILSRRDELGAFLRANTVQTNETGRGLVWLLPVAAARLACVHLVDLGASAGLNLVADQRHFALRDGNGRSVANLGHGTADDLAAHISGWPDTLAAEALRLPRVLSRRGGDLHPFRLAGPEDELTLSSFVWADQPARLRRLRRGISVFKAVNEGPTAVHLHALDLPSDLPAFLRAHVRADKWPVICYNTYIRMYLPDKGAALRAYLAAWARERQRPVWWLQWEPPSCLEGDLGPAPALGWLAWTLDVWQGAQHARHLLGWVHPHGQEVRLAPGFVTWLAGAKEQ